MTSTVLFIPPNWNITSAADTQYQTLMALLADNVTDTKVRGLWERELSRIAVIQKEYVLAPWTGNPYHACEHPYVVVGELSTNGENTGTADVYIKESDLPEFLDSITDVLRVLKAKGRVRSASWPRNFRG